MARKVQDKTKVNPKELARLKYRATNIRPGRLKLNMIDSGVIVSVNYRGETVNINKGWAEFILLMLSYIYDCYPDKYMKALERGKVCSQNFDVTKFPPNYNSYGNETYEIPGTPYYLMTNMSTTALLKAIQGFPDALEIEDEDLLMNINPNGEIEDGLRYVENIEIKRDIVDITELDLNKLDTYTFSCGYIWEKKVKANSYDSLAVQIIKDLLKKDKGNIDIAIKASIAPVVGVAEQSDSLTALETAKLTRGSAYTYYTNKSQLYTLKYIFRLLDLAGLPKSCVKIKIDKLSLSD